MRTYSDYSVSLRTAPIDQGLSYWEKGEGPVLLFLHGALANGYTWRKVLPDLSSSFRCIALHLPLGGHDIPLSRAADLSPAGIAGLIHRFLQHKQISRLILVSNDTGNAYAQVYASLYPESLRALIFSNGEVSDVFPPPAFTYLRYAVKLPLFSFLMGKLLSRPSSLTRPGAFGHLSLRVRQEELSQGYIYTFVRQAGIRRDFSRAARHWHPSHTLRAASLLRGFRAPVLILWGDQDTHLFPRAVGEKLLEVFPGARWVDIPGASTYIQEDAPEATIEAIADFASGLRD